jgi:hypothetical protein
MERIHYRKSIPIPTWKPLRAPSLALAAIGTPKLASTRIQSNLYTKPTPADIDGLEMTDATFSARVLPRIMSDRHKSLVPRNILVSRVSRRPAFTNKWALIGQCGFLGMSEMALKPAAQYISPPRESTETV